MTTRWRPEPSSGLAYVLGVLSGDGYIVKAHGYHYDIELLVKDHEFAETFSRAIAKLLNKKNMEPYWSKNHNRWRIYYRSKTFYIWYWKQTLETLKPFMEYNMETIKHFLRGLYDSDGSNYRCRQIFLSNNDIEMLHYVQYLLKKHFNIVATGPYLVTRAGWIHVKKNVEKIKTNQDNYSIDISRKQCVQRFLSEIGFSIQEKQLGLPRRK